VSGSVSTGNWWIVVLIVRYHALYLDIDPDSWAAGCIVFGLWFVRSPLKIWWSDSWSYLVIGFGMLYSSLATRDAERYRSDYCQGIHHTRFSAAPFPLGMSAHRCSLQLLDSNDRSESVLLVSHPERALMSSLLFPFVSTYGGARLGFRGRIIWYRRLWNTPSIPVFSLRELLLRWSATESTESKFFRLDALAGLITYITMPHNFIFLGKSTQSFGRRAFLSFCVKHSTCYRANVSHQSFPLPQVRWFTPESGKKVYLNSYLATWACPWSLDAIVSDSICVLYQSQCSEESTWGLGRTDPIVANVRTLNWQLFPWVEVFKTNCQQRQGFWALFYPVALAHCRF